MENSLLGIVLAECQLVVVELLEKVLERFHVVELGTYVVD